MTKFYCSYCYKIKEPDVADIHYKKSIKCSACVGVPNYAFYTCICGCEVAFYNRYGHNLSINHKKFMVEYMKTLY